MSELLREALHEITAEPLVFSVEVLQFLLLVFIIKRFLWPSLVSKPLLERQENIKRQIEEVKQAGEVLSKAAREAANIKKEAREKAEAIIKKANAEAVKERRLAKKAILEETTEILNAAKRSIENEKKRIESETGEELTDLISLVMRQYCDEVLSEQERRELTKNVVLSKLAELEASGSRTTET